MLDGCRPHSLETELIDCSLSTGDDVERWKNFEAKHHGHFKVRPHLLPSTISSLTRTVAFKVDSKGHGTLMIYERIAGIAAGHAADLRLHRG